MFTSAAICARLCFLARTSFYHLTSDIHLRVKFPDRVSISEEVMAKIRAAQGLLPSRPGGTRYRFPSSSKDTVMKDMRAVNLFVNVVLICMICLNVVVGGH